MLRFHAMLLRHYAAHASVCAIAIRHAMPCFTFSAFDCFAAPLFVARFRYALFHDAASHGCSPRYACLRRLPDVTMMPPLLRRR